MASPQHAAPDGSDVRRSYDLSRLISPVDVETFAREYWERQPLIVERNDAAYFRDLLSLEDVDRILSSTSFHSTQVQVVRDGKPRGAGANTPVASMNAEFWYEEYRSGSTIVLQALHDRWRPLKDLCRALAEEFSAAFQVNVYLTPPAAQGFSTHYDTHDVFVVQVAGSKRWRVYEPTIQLPLYGQPYQKELHGVGRLIREVDLRAGDVMYLPRGYPHDAVSLDMCSLHLAVGALTITWASVLLGAVEAAIEGSTEYRRSLPIGFARDGESRRKVESRMREIAKHLIGGIDNRATVRNAVELARQSIPPDLEGHLLDLEREPNINLETDLRIRPGTHGRLSTDGDMVSLNFHGKSVSMPGFVRPALEFIMRAESFAAGDLPGGLDETGRITLVRRLLHEGYLTISSRRHLNGS